jgi:hypothetical protein
MATPPRGDPRWERDADEPQPGRGRWQRNG